MNGYVYISIAFTVVALLLLLQKVLQDAVLDPDCWLNRPRCRQCRRRLVFSDYCHPSGTKDFYCDNNKCTRYLTLVRK